MPLPTLLENRCRAEVAVKAAKQAAAARTAMNAAGQSAKVAVNCAGQSVMSALRDHHSSSWSWEPPHEETHSPLGTGLKSLLKKLPTTLWKSNSGSDSPGSSNVTVCDEEMSEVSTMSPQLCSGDSEILCLSDSEHDGDESEYCSITPVADTSLPGLLHFASREMPLKCRQQFWQRCFSVTEVGDVESLQTSVPSDLAHQIDLDVPRTSPHSLGESDRSVLRRVLRAYATYDPVVGYCQGMNDIVGVFVRLGFNESESLCGLSSMLKSCCPDYFCPSLKGYLCDMAVLKVLVGEVLSSEMVQTLDDLDVPLHAFAAHHFFTLAAHTWPLEAVVRLWDLLFLEGSSAVFASFLALLQLYLPRVRNLAGCLDGPEQVEAFLKAVSNGVAEELDSILEHTRQLIQHIPMSRIECLRRGFSDSV
jgi:hypothetical protein